MTYSGKVVFITGGLGGMGLSIGENFLQQGAKVALLDVTDGTEIEKELQKKYGGRVIVIQCDITVIQQLRDSYQKTVDTFGGLDIVINGAGVIDEINYERAIAVNMTAVITSSYMAVERMRKDNGGRGGILVNIASAAGFSCPIYFLAYNASKAGVIAFDKSLVKNLGDVETTGIQVGTICPGKFETNIVQFNPNPTYREKDITQPNAEEKLAYIVAGAAKVKGADPQRMSDVLMKYLADPNFHGSGIVVDKGTAHYAYPQNLEGQQINMD